MFKTILLLENKIHIFKFYEIGEFCPTFVLAATVGELLTSFVGVARLCQHEVKFLTFSSKIYFNIARLNLLSSSR